MRSFKIERIHVQARYLTNIKSKLLLCPWPVILSISLMDPSHSLFWPTSESVLSLACSLWNANFCSLITHLHTIDFTVLTSQSQEILTNCNQAIYFLHDKPGNVLQTIGLGCQQPLHVVLAFLVETQTDIKVLSQDICDVFIPPDTTIVVKQHLKNKSSRSHTYIS